uniref:Uncharacterized protein n=1 Tax=Onchocerca volvulus TaxID=6282 RepID=A0A8R1TYB5_ONCVO
MLLQSRPLMVYFHLLKDTNLSKADSYFRFFPGSKPQKNIYGKLSLENTEHSKYIDNLKNLTSDGSLCFDLKFRPKNSFRHEEN